MFESILLLGALAWAYRAKQLWFVSKVLLVVLGLLAYLVVGGATLVSLIGMSETLAWMFLLALLIGGSYACR